MSAQRGRGGCRSASRLAASTSRPAAPTDPERGLPAFGLGKRVSHAAAPEFTPPQGHTPHCQPASQPGGRFTNRLQLGCPRWPGAAWEPLPDLGAPWLCHAGIGSGASPRTVPLCLLGCICRYFLAPKGEVMTEAETEIASTATDIKSLQASISPAPTGV